MKDDDRRLAAQAILDIPFFGVLMDEMEMSAINGCIHAPLTDHETRAAYAAETRAIRNFRSKLKLQAEQAKAGGKAAPA